MLKKKLKSLVTMLMCKCGSHEWELSYVSVTDAWGSCKAGIGCKRCSKTIELHKGWRYYGGYDIGGRHFKQVNSEHMIFLGI